MLDFHSHILQQIDDGSSDIETSIKMLEELEKQGVDTVVITPHFYPVDEEIKDFVKRRDEALDKLKASYKGNIKLLKGCEVHYFDSINICEDIDYLCIENTDLLLLELPMSRKIDIEKIVALNTKLQVVLAHIERYLGIYSRKEINTLVNHEVYLQSNCEVFNDKDFRIIKDYFEDGAIKFIGTDCHDLEERKPNYKEATKFIEDKYSKEYLDEFEKEMFEVLKERSI